MLRLLVQGQTNRQISSVLAAMMFFAIGSLKSLVLAKPVLSSGFMTLLTGGGAAMLAYVAGALLREGLLDELIVYMAPALLGDRARPLLSLPLDDMADKVQLQIEDVRKVGQDWRFIARPA